MRKKGKQVLAALMGVFLFCETLGRTGLLNENPQVIYAETNRAATVNATSLNVRSGPGTGNSVVKRLLYGTAVTVTEETTGSDGNRWYKIRFASGTGTAEGYVSASYIKFPVSYTMDANFETYLTQQGFPESYKDSLRTLHAEHPSWVFQVQNTGLDWNDVISNESLVGANLVGTNSISSWKSTEYGAYDWGTGAWTGFDGASWVAASKEIVSYYMDPRNFLNDTYVFQFLLHTYDGSRHTAEGLKSLVSGTFLENSVSSENSGSGSNGGSGQGAGENGSGSGQGAGESSGGPGQGTGENGQSGNTGQPGDVGQSGNTGSGQTLRPGENYGPGFENTQGSPAGSPSTQPMDGAGAGGGSQDVSLEGPSVSVSARETQVLAVPNVEYGPGMDASSITEDHTGESSTSPVPSESYVNIIMRAAAQSGVNPYVLGAMILQEQGKGTSGSISGTTSGYEGYYNFFNVGAYASGSMSAVTRGLWYASQTGNYGRPWNSIEKSIVGGACYYGENFVKQGQDTFYLKKFNVQGTNLYKHQYMTNVEGAAGEAAKLARAYTDEMKRGTLVFKIPVYSNMPETACARPAGTGSPNNKLSSLEVTGYALTPTFNRDTESYDIIVNPSVDKISVNAAAIDSKASVAGTGTVSLQSGNNTIQVEVKAENGSVRTYRLHVVRQSDAPVVNVNPGSQTTGNSAGSSAEGTRGPGTEIGPGGIMPGETVPAAGSENGAAETTVASATTGVQAGIGPGGETAPAAGSETEAAETTAASAGSGTQDNIGPGWETTPAETQAPETQAPETQAAETSEPETQAAGTQAALQKGDCNGDGSVTILDLILIKRQILGENVLNEAQKAAADLNGDGAITQEDAKALQKKIMGRQ